MMTIEEYRAAILQCLLDAKNEDGTPAITPKEAQEALNGFTDSSLLLFLYLKMDITLVYRWILLL